MYINIHLSVRTYTKIIEHQPTYTYETSGEDTITRCEISIDTLIPTTLLSQQSQQNMSQQSQQSSLGLSSLQSQGLLSQHQFIIPTTPMVRVSLVLCMKIQLGLSKNTPSLAKSLGLVKHTNRNTLQIFFTIGTVGQLSA